MKIEQAVIDALKNAQIVANTLTLTGSLSRKVYTETDKVLNAVAGHWNKASKMHVWNKSVDVQPIIDKLIKTGEVTHLATDFEFFPTPSTLITNILKKVARPDTIKKALEPSAGQGSIVQAMTALLPKVKVDCFEFAEQNITKLEEFGIKAKQADFLQVKAKPAYDLIAMNPPFASHADIRHVAHATKFLKPATGQLLAITSSGVKSNSDKESEAFRELVKSLGGVIEDLPSNSFKESGTGVSTCLIWVDLAKPKKWQLPVNKTTTTKVDTGPAKSLVEMIAEMEESDRRIAECTQKLKEALSSCLSPNEKAELEKMRPKPAKLERGSSVDTVLQALEISAGNISSLLVSKHPAVYSEWLRVVEQAIDDYKARRPTCVKSRSRTCQNIKLDRRLSRIWQSSALTM